MSIDSPTNDPIKRAEPESLRGRDLMASLTVNDIEASLTWYCDVVGFTVGEKYERGGKLMAVSLKAGTVRILIGQDDGAKGRDRIKGQGISLQVTTAQDIDVLAAEIKERGGTLASEPIDTPWGARMFRLKDPDGFIMTLSSER